MIKRLTSEDIKLIKEKTESYVLFGKDMALIIEEDVPKLLDEIEMLQRDIELLKRKGRRCK